MNCLSLDPSVNNVGYCFCHIPDDEMIPVKFDKCDWEWGVWTLHGANLEEKFEDLRFKIEAEMQTLAVENLHKIIVEWPQYYDTMKGHIASEQNYTINLAAVASFVLGYFWSKFGYRIDPHMVTAPRWKGNVPKEITAKRFYRQFGETPFRISEHAVDATMMLLWKLKDLSLIHTTDL